MLSGVQVEKTTSTASAVQATLQDTQGEYGAIASKICLKIYQDLEILFEDIQDNPSMV